LPGGNNGWAETAATGQFLPFRAAKNSTLPNFLLTNSPESPKKKGRHLHAALPPTLEKF
jgi:hypothetical protein